MFCVKYFYICVFYYGCYCRSYSINNAEQIKNENIAVTPSLNLIVFYFQVVLWNPGSRQATTNIHFCIVLILYIHSQPNSCVCVCVCVCVSVYPDSCKTSIGASLDPAVRPPLSQPIIITLSLLLAPRFISTHTGEIRPFKEDNASMSGPHHHPSPLLSALRRRSNLCCLSLW